MFLSLSDKVFNTELDFFISPHNTKVIWGGHRVVYIFTHVSSHITLYYDIEMPDPIKDVIAGGNGFPTTTIIMKNRIFVPVPPLLVPSFYIEQGKKEFYIRFDSIVTN